MKGKIGCEMCRRDPNPPNSDQRDCAFLDDGSFTPDNWNCASMNILRGARDHSNGAPGAEVGNEGDNMMVLPIPEDVLPDAPYAFVVLLYYKQRGRTSQAWVMSEEGVNRRLTRDDMERIIAAKVFRP